MKTLFILNLVLMSLVSFPSWGLAMEDLVLREGIYYRKFTNKPFTGQITGDTEKGSIEKGAREGEWLKFHKNGQLWWIGSYQTNLKNGVWSGYSKDGNLVSKGSYLTGKKEGLWEYFNEGKLSEKGSYLNDYQNGVWLTFHPSGVVAIKENFRMSIREGPYEKYFSNGNVHSTGNFKEGRKVGYWEYFYPNGNYHSKGSYGKYEQKEGEWIFFNPDQTKDLKNSGYFSRGYKIRDS